MTHSTIIIENKFDKPAEELLKLYPQTNSATSNIINTQNLDSIIKNIQNVSIFHLCALLNKDHEILRLLSEKIKPLSESINNPDFKMACYQNFYNQMLLEGEPQDNFLKYLNAQKIVYLNGEYISFDDLKTKIDNETKEMSKNIPAKLITTLKGRQQFNKIKKEVKDKYIELFKDKFAQLNTKAFKDYFKQFTNDNSYKAILNFIKAICLADNNENYFEESVVSFNK